MKRHVFHRLLLFFGVAAVTSNVFHLLQPHNEDLGWYTLKLSLVFVTLLVTRLVVGPEPDAYFQFHGEPGTVVPKGTVVRNHDGTIHLVTTRKAKIKKDGSSVIPALKVKR